MVKQIYRQKIKIVKHYTITKLFENYLTKFLLNFFYGDQYEKTKILFLWSNGSYITYKFQFLFSIVS